MLNAALWRRNQKQKHFSASKAGHRDVFSSWYRRGWLARSIILLLSKFESTSSNSSVLAPTPPTLDANSSTGRALLAIDVQASRLVGLLRQATYRCYVFFLFFTVYRLRLGRKDDPNHRDRKDLTGKLPLALLDATTTTSLVPLIP